MPTNPSARHSHPHARRIAGVLGLALLTGCGSLLPPPPAPEKVYVLEATSPSTDARPAAPRAIVLAVSTPRARAGYDTDRMVWVRQAHGLEVFARNRWADTPARMLAPLLVQSLQRSGTFQAIVPASSNVSAHWRLDTEVIRLQHDFSTTPSRVQLNLGVQLVDLATRRVIASAEFEEMEPAASEDPYGGVLAANRALLRLLTRVTAFCKNSSG